MSISSVFVIFSPKMITKSIVSRNPNFKSQFLSSISLRPLTRSRISIQKRHKRCSSTVTATSTSPSLLEQLPPKLQEIIRAFQTVQEPKMKYEQLLFYGRKLNPLGSQFKINENKVRGCVSQVWVRAFLDTEKNIFYEADSDSVLTKGLAALLVEGLSGRPALEIVQISPDFVQLLGIQQSLTPSRNNGFLNMLKLMQRKALELLVEAEGIDDSVKNSREADGGKPDGFNNVAVSSNGQLEIENESKAPNSSNVLEMNSNGTLGSRGQRMKDKLEKELQPTQLEIEDISYQHAGHAGVRGSDGETHFNLRVVSKEFEGKSMVKRHRLIYDLVQEELQSGLHALSIVAKTPSEV